jgi:gliding motility-associated-like protein
MKKIQISLITILFFMPLYLFGQKTSPTVSYTFEGDFYEVSSIEEAQAPLDATFKANPSDMDGHTVAYEWHFRKRDEGKGLQELFVRYEEDTQYTFNESGRYEVTLKYFIDNDDVAWDSTTISIFIADSWLEFPNAFSPNGDGYNDKFQAKKGYKSIVDFHAYIINRWGQKLFEWTNPADGWDGTYKGKDVSEGVYFVLVKARGGDGKEYNIRKDVNLLRKHLEGGNSSGK